MRPASNADLVDAALDDGSGQVGTVVDLRIPTE
jgi:hypothetical protein